MKIAIVRRNGLGDLIAVMPLVALCKERYPGCHMTLFVDRRNAPLLPYLYRVRLKNPHLGDVKASGFEDFSTERGIQGIDEAVIIEPSKNKYFSLFKTLWKNRHRAFDLVISARPAPMQWMNLFLAGLKARRRLAVVQPGSWHSRWINEPVQLDKGEHHQMLKSLKLLDVSFNEVPERFLPRLHVEKKYQFDKKTILVSVTNHRIGSQLDSDKIARHLNAVLKKDLFQVILNGEPKDAARMKDLAQRLEIPYQIMLTLHFDDFMGLLASVDASWTGDGGIMHLMAALDKPQLVLFGKTPLWEWAPLSKKAICIWHPENVNLIPESAIEEGLERLVYGLR
jgi:ADP-heptose:LPS heptosyltransferase